jgi:hypothetical protein
MISAPVTAGCGRILKCGTFPLDISKAIISKKVVGKAVNALADLV